MPNAKPRNVVPAPRNTPCGWSHGTLTCMTGDMAVHVLTTSTWTVPAGTAVCGFHSPEDVLYMWDVTFTPDLGTAGRPVNTHTWGRTRMDAYTRVVQTMDDQEGMWDGWSFTLADAPTPNQYA